MIAPRQAYEKGYRSGLTQVDPDEAIERFSRKYCEHSVIRFCNLEHAWWNGFQDAPYGSKHSLTCPLGVDTPQGHADCPRD